MRVRRYRIRVGSGGAGSARGGDGIERDLEMLEEVGASGPARHWGRPDPEVRPYQRFHTAMVS